MSDFKAFRILLVSSLLPTLMFAKDWDWKSLTFKHSFKLKLITIDIGNFVDSWSGENLTFAFCKVLIIFRVNIDINWFQLLVN